MIINFTFINIVHYSFFLLIGFDVKMSSSVDYAILYLYLFLFWLLVMIMCPSFSLFLETEAGVRGILRGLKGETLKRENSGISLLIVVVMILDLTFGLHLVSYLAKRISEELIKYTYYPKSALLSFDGFYNDSICLCNPFNYSLS